MKQEQAETLAIQALGWLAGQDDLMGVFMGSTGVDVNTVKENAADPAFLGSVLDFILLEDGHVTGFCDAFGLAYDLPMQARQTLPGGAQVNWT